MLGFPYHDFGLYVWTRMALGDFCNHRNRRLPKKVSAGCLMKRFSPKLHQVLLRMTGFARVIWEPQKCLYLPRACESARDKKQASDWENCATQRHVRIFSRTEVCPWGWGGSGLAQAHMCMLYMYTYTCMCIYIYMSAYRCMHTQRHTSNP